MTKQDATDVCSTAGGRLVEIDDGDMQNFLQRYIVTKVISEDFIEANWWTGGRIEPSARQWIWDDGTSL